MYKQISKWIENLIQSHDQVLAVAIKQRSKFEGWLKIELANQALNYGANDIEFEVTLPDDNGQADLALSLDGIRYYIELKTANTNWRLPGVLNLRRPITKNVNSIISDGYKLRNSKVNGIVAFVMFPIPVGDKRWEEYFERITNALSIDNPPFDSTKQISTIIGDSLKADVVIGSLPIGRVRKNDA